MYYLFMYSKFYSFGFAGWNFDEIVKVSKTTKNGATETSNLETIQHQPSVMGAYK